MSISDELAEIKLASEIRKMAGAGAGLVGAGLGGIAGLARAYLTDSDEEMQAPLSGRWKRYAKHALGGAAAGAALGQGLKSVFSPAAAKVEAPPPPASPGAAPAGSSVQYPSGVPKVQEGSLGQLAGSVGDAAKQVISLPGKAVSGIAGAAVDYASGKFPGVTGLKERNYDAAADGAASGALGGALLQHGVAEPLFAKLMRRAAQAGFGFTPAAKASDKVRGAIHPMTTPPGNPGRSLADVVYDESARGKLLINPQERRTLMQVIGRAPEPAPLGEKVDDLIARARRRFRAENVATERKNFDAANKPLKNETPRERQARITARNSQARDAAKAKDTAASTGDESEVQKLRSTLVNTLAPSKGKDGKKKDGAEGGKQKGKAEPVDAAKLQKSRRLLRNSAGALLGGASGFMSGLAVPRPVEPVRRDPGSLVEEQGR